MTLTSQEVMTGDSALFYCKASGVPPPKILWYKSGQEVQTDYRCVIQYGETESGAVSTLVVVEVEEEEGVGVYRAEAVNQHGKDVTEAVLMGKGGTGSDS